MDTHTKRTEQMKIKPWNHNLSKFDSNKTILIIKSFIFKCELHDVPPVLGLELRETSNWWLHGMYLTDDVCVCDNRAILYYTIVH